MFASLVRRIGHALAALGVNLVPAGGWFFGSWSSGTVLAIYWFENVVACLFIAARILLHRRFRPCRGHFQYGARPNAKLARTGTFLSHFLPTSLIFSAAHGFFLAVILTLLTMNGQAGKAAVNWTELGHGLVLVLGFLAFDFVVDAPGLRERPFAWIERMAERNMMRVVVVHLAIIFGMAAVAFTGMDPAFFGAFLVLKTMLDLSTVLPQWEPERPPAWLCALMNRIPNAQKGRPGRLGQAKTFEEFWTADRELEIERKAANERPCEPPLRKRRR